jgi:hypothetical protein
VDYEWSTETPPETREHRLTSVIRTCAEHPGLTGAFLYSAIADENRRKNTTQGIAQAINPNLTPQVYQWAFDANRVLEVSWLTTEPVAKRQIQDQCDLQFGPGLVAVL